MKIAYLCMDFGIPVRGHKGASVHVREMVTALTAQGHDVRVITANGDGDNQLAAPVHVIKPGRLPAPCERALRYGFGRRQRGVVETRELAHNVTVYRRAWEAMASWRPDAIYERYSLFNVSGVALARRLGMPHLLEVNAPLRIERARNGGLVLDPLARMVERTVFAQSDAVLVVSTALQRYAITHGARPSTVTVQPNGVDTGRFVPEQGRLRARSRWNIPPDAFVAGFSGSLKPWHGVNTLLDAFALLRERDPSARLLIVGEGPCDVELQMQAEGLGLGDAVVFTGKVIHAEMPELLTAMDVGVAPYLSLPDFYFSPLKIYEYMAAGLPVVASDAGDITTLVHHGRTGILFPPAEVASLADALTQLAFNPELRVRLGKAARGEAELHTWDANARLVAGLARDLSDDRASQSRIAVGRSA